MPWWAWVILVVVALGVFKFVQTRRRYRDPQFYFARASARMDQVERILDRTQANLLSGKPSPAQLAIDLNNLRAVTQLQATDAVPHPSMESHKQQYLQFMDLQRRELEDIVATGGQNLESLVAEEEALLAESNAEWGRSYDEMKALADATEIAMPEWATRPPGR